MSGSISAWGWQETLARWFVRDGPPAWHVALNRVASDRWGSLAEPHPETSYARQPVPNTIDHWMGVPLFDHDEITAWQNKTPLSWQVRSERLDLWLPIVGWALCDPDGHVVFSADLPFPIDEYTLDNQEIRIRPGDLFIAGVWLGSGVAYWEAV